MYKIKNKNLVEKKLLYDGAEQYIFGKSTISISFNKDIEIKFSFIRENKLSNFQKDLDNISFQKITDECNVKIDGFLPIYRNSDKMSVYFFIEDDYLILASFGETQPSRYKIYLEGVWELEEGD